MNSKKKKQTGITSILDTATHQKKKKTQEQVQESEICSLKLRSCKLSVNTELESINTYAEHLL